MPHDCLETFSHFVIMLASVQPANANETRVSVSTREALLDQPTDQAEWFFHTSRYLLSLFAQFWSTCMSSQHDENQPYERD